MKLRELELSAVDNFCRRAIARVAVSQRADFLTGTKQARLLGKGTAIGGGAKPAAPDFAERPAILPKSGEKAGE
jgi:hypothetical protein